MFSILMGGCAWLFSVIMSVALMTVCDPQMGIMEWLPQDLLYICAVFVFASIMIPVQLKFGGERGRVALLLIVGIAVIGGMGVVKLIELLDIDLDVILASMNALTMIQLSGAVLILSLLLLVLSYWISCRIVKHKEF